MRRWLLGGEAGFFAAGLAVKLRVPPVEMTAFGGVERDDGKSKMRGFLHSATDGKTVRCSGRDDAFSAGVRRTTAKTKANAGLSTSQRTVKLSVAPVEMTLSVVGRWSRQRQKQPQARRFQWRV